MAAHVSETAKHRSQRLGDSGPLFVWKTLSFSLVSEATTKQSIHQMFFHPNGSQWLFNSVFFAKKNWCSEILRALARAAGVMKFRKKGEDMGMRHDPYFLKHLGYIRPRHCHIGKTSTAKILDRLRRPNICANICQDTAPIHHIPDTTNRTAICPRQTPPVLTTPCRRHRFFVTGWPRGA